ncbi:hypothetical protein BH09PSE5_BH09PSE5_06970 [soil metagenome]
MQDEEFSRANRIYGYAVTAAILGGVVWYIWSGLPTRAEKDQRRLAERQSVVAAAAESHTSCRLELEKLIATRKQRFEEYRIQQTKLPPEVLNRYPVNPGEWVFLDEDEKGVECHFSQLHASELANGMDSDEAVKRLAERSTAHTLGSLKARNIDLSPSSR